MPEQPVVDRRSVVKTKHHQAIIDAAVKLMERTGGTDFTVDELARAADVSRRTVFNHFETVDDVVIAGCGEVLRPIIDALDATPKAVPTADEDGARATVFDELATTLRRTDVVPAMARVGHMLGVDPVEPTPRQAMLLLRAMTDVGARVSATLARRHPEVDALTVEVMVSAFMGGTITIHRRWIAQTNGLGDDEARRVWSELLERLIDTIGSGRTTARESRPAHG